MSRPIKVTALQRLGKRVDHLDAAVRSHGTRLDGLAQRVQELAQTFAETAHMGSFEAMYRLEREENIRLRQNGHAPLGETALVEGWIAQLEGLVQQLRGGPPPELCLAHNHQHPVGACGEWPITDDERRIVEKFGVELSKGLAETSLAAQQPVPTARCPRCGQLHPAGWHC